MEARFEWDEAKAESNVRKHGVTFDEALQVFGDPDAIQEYDGRYGEERWQTVGRVGRATLVLVAHTIRTSAQVTVIRIISARPADKRERKRYEQQ